MLKCRKRMGECEGDLGPKIVISFCLHYYETVGVAGCSIFIEKSNTKKDFFIIFECCVLGE